MCFGRGRSRVIGDVDFPRVLETLISLCFEICSFQLWREGPDYLGKFSPKHPNKSILNSVHGFSYDVGGFFRILLEIRFCVILGGKAQGTYANFRRKIKENNVLNWVLGFPSGFGGFLKILLYIRYVLLFWFSKKTKNVESKLGTEIFLGCCKLFLDFALNVVFFMFLEGKAKGP